MSELWEAVREARGKNLSAAPPSFDWFVLALNLLYAVSAIDNSNGILRQRHRNDPSIESSLPP